jgi:hypothetical protein
MKMNVGGIDRLARIVVGIGITALAFVGPKSPWAYLGLIPLATGVLGWCPPYDLFGISSSRGRG